MTHIKFSPEYGRSMYASRSIGLGTLIEVCEVLVLSYDDTRAVNGLTDLQYYTFVYDAETGQDCLVLGNGEIFNHAPTELNQHEAAYTANVSYTLEYFVSCET